MAAKSPTTAAASLPPLYIGIYRNGELVDTVEVPDPRSGFCRYWAEMHQGDGLTAAPLSVESAAIQEAGKASGKEVTTKPKRKPRRKPRKQQPTFPLATRHMALYCPVTGEIKKVLPLRFTPNDPAAIPGLIESYNRLASKRKGVFTLMMLAPEGMEPTPGEL